MPCGLTCAVGRANNLGVRSRDGRVRCRSNGIGRTDDEDSPIYGAAIPVGTGQRPSLATKQNTWPSSGPNLHQTRAGTEITDSAPPEDASSHDHVAGLAASRWAKVCEQLKRFRAPLAGAAVIVVALIALAFVRLPVWQTIATIASVGAVLGGLAGFWNAYAAVKKSVPLSGSSKAPATASARSVLVLPFHNHTGDASQAYVADGLTASVTADLSRIRDAFIVNAATAFAYKDKPITAQQAGTDLCRI